MLLMINILQLIHLSNDLENSKLCLVFLHIIHLFITQTLNISQDLHCCFASSIYSLSNYQLDQCIWFPHLITDFFRVVCRSRWQKEKDKSKGLQIYGCWCFVALSMYNTDEVSFLILLEFWYQIIEWLGTDLFHSILSIRALAETSMNTASEQVATLS